MKGADETPADELKSEVLKLYYVDELSIRAISRRLHVSRKTVRRILGKTPGRSESRPHPANRLSLLDPYLDFIRNQLSECSEMKAPAMLERLRRRGYTGGVSILRDQMRALRPTPLTEAFLTQSFEPGQVAMVDWADFGYAIPGIPRRVNGFVMMLGYSRRMYLEYSLSQKMGSFLRCMERAVAFFGGVTLCDIFDNMKTVVLEHRPPHRPVFNERFIAYAAARGFAVHACNPRRGNEKGGVERGIKFVRDRFWPNRRFTGLHDLNHQAAVWRDTFANNREHHITGKVPQLVFEHEEKQCLKPVPDRPFDLRDHDSGTVNKSFRIRFDRNLYSVPWPLVSQHVQVRADDSQVYVFLGPKQVAVHERCWGIREDIEDKAHRGGLKEHKPKASADALPYALSGLGEAGQKYFRVLAAGGRSIRRETIRLCLFVELFGETPVRSAVEQVMRHGHVGMEYVEYVLRHDPTVVPAPEPLRLGKPELDEMHALEPDMSVYDQVLGNMPTRDPGADNVENPG